LEGEKKGLTMILKYDNIVVASNTIMSLLSKETGMKKLTINEQIFLIAIWHLNDEAYGVKIREKIIKMTGSSLLFGTLYNTLDYLSQKGYVISRKVKSPNQKGGNKRVYYEITEDGQNALQKSRELHESIWKEVPKHAFDSTKK
jgi:DNA-binding PadR family transcriptional regulator